MVLAFILGNLILLLGFYVVCIKRVQNAIHQGNVHAQNMYRLGMSDGKVKAWQDITKFYTAENKPKSNSDGTYIN